MSLTPAMKQYVYFKDKYPDCLLLFRMGDFYETFYEDAKKASEVLEITLTSRGKGDSRAPLAGIPYHALEPYLSKLVKNNIKVAICEQVEDPKQAKGIVKRDVTRIVTPGTVMDNIMLDENSNNYIATLNQNGNLFSFSFCDISTGEFFTFSCNEEELNTQFSQFQPKELILPLSLTVNTEIKELLKTNNIYYNVYDDRHFKIDNAKTKLLTHFKILNLEGFGINNPLEISTSGALIQYLQETQFNSLSHIKKVRKVNLQNYMILDSTTLRNLEIIRNLRDNTNKGTLFETLNKTCTSMGTRSLKKWIQQPLLEKKKIEERLNSIEHLLKDSIKKEKLSSILKSINDLERIISRINYGNANARDLLSLRNSLEFIPQLKEIIPTETDLLKDLGKIPNLENIYALLKNTIKEDPPILLRDGNIIKPEYNEILKELHNIKSNSKQIIIEIETKEKNRTKIKNLRIRFNKVFGYFIEISKGNIHLAPEDYIRKQTLVNAERFITPELKEIEEKILNSHEQISNLEFEIFQSIISEIKKYTFEIQDTANKISILDCLLSFATVSENNNYSKPQIHEENYLELKNARHPVIENKVSNYVPNDLKIYGDEIIIISGPNMSGKSSFMRQVALNVLMAHIGCFIPAEDGKIPLTDRIFTRVGAHDDLTQGQSTFMLEMSETANILNNATSKSLIILDEIGRGTSTFDGVAIAWSVSEYIHNYIKAKTLFATHYHILNKLTNELKNVKNFNIAVKEEENEIIFLRKLIPGGTDKSYGIHVAKLAGLPASILERAKEIQNEIESEDKIKQKIKTKKIEEIQEKLL